MKKIQINKKLLELIIKELKENGKINYVDNEITPTNEFLNGKRIYQKRLVTTAAMERDINLVIKHGVSNYAMMWIDMNNSFYFSTETKRCLPLVQTHYTNTSSTDTTSVFIDGDNINLISRGGWGNAWQKVVVVKFIYNN